MPLFYPASSFSRKSAVRALATGVATCCVLLAGCSLDSNAVPSAANDTSLGGTVHGGETPISGAIVTLYATTSAGYGRAAQVLATANAPTDAGGAFSFSNATYTCPAGAQAYVASVGGNSGTFAANPNIVLVSAIGPCANLSRSTFVIINELSTVAAAYALNAFTSMNGTTVNISTSATNNAGPANNGVGTSTSAAGLYHAFQTASNLVSGGGTSATTPSGTGIIPLREINTLGNILQVCVNSVGGVAGDKSLCGNLFTNTTTPAQTTVPTNPGYNNTAVVPTNTFQAMLNLAQFPRTGTSALYNSATAQSAFQPALTAAPPDFMVAIAYPQTQPNPAGIYSTNGPVTNQTEFPTGYPLDVELDANDAVYGLVGDNGNTTTAYLFGMQNNGAPIFTQAPQTTYPKVQYMTLDGLGHIWLPNAGGSSTSTPPAALVE
jgi:hypothetical protein